MEKIKSIKRIKRGRHHVNGETPCQDAAGVMYSSDNLKIFGVADGIGSFKDSGIIAKCLFDAELGIKLSRVISKGIVKSDILFTIQQYIGSVCESYDIQDGDSTLSLCIVEDDMTTLFIVGDSPAYVISDSLFESGVNKITLDKEKLGLASNETYALRTAKQDDTILSSYPTAFVKAVVLMTDGLENIIANDNVVRDYIEYDSKDFDDLIDFAYNNQSDDASIIVASFRNEKNPPLLLSHNREWIDKVSIRHTAVASKRMNINEVAIAAGYHPNGYGCNLKSEIKNVDGTYTYVWISSYTCD